MNVKRVCAIQIKSKCAREENITPPTRGELWEGGYFYQAKLIVLRDFHRSGARARCVVAPDELFLSNA